MTGGRAGLTTTSTHEGRNDGARTGAAGLRQTRAAFPDDHVDVAGATIGAGAANDAADDAVNDPLDVGALWKASAVEFELSAHAC